MMQLRWLDDTWVRRGLFVVVNSAAALVVAVLVIGPVRDLLERRDAQIAEQRSMLARFMAVAAQEATVETAAKQAPADKGAYLTGSNDGVVNADLQTRLKALVEAAGAHLRTVSALPPLTVEQLRYIGSHVDIFGSLPSIHRAVAAIESAKPFLFVRGAVIKPAPSAGPATASQEPVIDAQLDVFGALRNSVSGR
jgi:general secretion pathway protein M